jgi:hypothetical protein
MLSLLKELIVNRNQEESAKTKYTHIKKEARQKEKERFKKEEKG